MANFSRRSLADYAARQLVAGEKPSYIAKRLAAALVATKKQKEADLLLGDISQVLENRGLVAETHITSANQLTPELRKLLSAHIQKAAKVKDVILNEKIDKSVIGGLRVETANHVWDRTIARELTDIKGGI